MLFAVGAGLDQHDDVLQGNMVVTRYAAIRGLSSWLLSPGDGMALGCVVYASRKGRRLGKGLVLTWESVQS